MSEEDEFGALKKQLAKKEIELEIVKTDLEIERKKKELASLRAVPVIEEETEAEEEAEEEE